MQKITNSAIYNYEENDSNLVDELSIYIDYNKERIYSFFNINNYNDKPIINIVDNKNKLDDIHRKFNDLNFDDEVPKWIIGLSSSDMQIYYLSINDYNNTSYAFKKEDYDKVLDMYKRNLLHEYVHYVNRLYCKKNNCEFSIRYLSEGIAQYLSNQNDNKGLTFNYSINDILNSNNCYNGWYLVTKYIIDNYPHEFFLELLKDNIKAEKFIINSYDVISKYYNDRGCKMNYLVVVNKSNMIEESYYNNLELVECKDILGDTISVEKETYNAYIKLKEYLKNMNINIELDSAYRSIEEQQEIIDEYTEKYGIEYVNKFVAPIKTSEHHTGLALDIGLIIDNKKYIDSDELFNKEDIYLVIHKYLHKFGFILRYPKDKEDITGYNYEPWHIRYVGKEVASIIYNNNITLEEYVLKYKNIELEK